MLKARRWCPVERDGTRLHFVAESGVPFFMTQAALAMKRIELVSPQPAAAASTWLVGLGAAQLAAMVVLDSRALPDSMLWLDRARPFLMLLAEAGGSLALFQLSASLFDSPRVASAWAARLLTASVALRLCSLFPGLAAAFTGAFWVSMVASLAVGATVVVLGGPTHRRWTIPVVAVAMAVRLSPLVPGVATWSPRWLSFLAPVALALALRSVVALTPAAGTPQPLPLLVLLGLRDAVRGAVALALGLAVSAALLALTRHVGVLVVAVGAFGAGLGLWFRGVFRLFRATGGEA